MLHFVLRLQLTNRFEIILHQLLHPFRTTRPHFLTYYTGTDGSMAGWESSAPFLVSDEPLHVLEADDFDRYAADAEGEGDLDLLDLTDSPDLGHCTFILADYDQFQVMVSPASLLLPIFSWKEIWSADRSGLTFCDRTFIDALVDMLEETLKTGNRGICTLKLQIPWKEREITTKMAPIGNLGARNKSRRKEIYAGYNWGTCPTVLRSSRRSLLCWDCSPISGFSSSRLADVCVIAVGGRGFM